MLSHNSFLNSFDKLQEFQAKCSVDYVYLTSFSTNIQICIDDVYFENCNYKVDIYKPSSSKHDFIIVGYKELQYDCLDREQSNVIIYVINVKYNTNELKTSLDIFYNRLYVFLKTKKFIR